MLDLADLAGQQVEVYQVCRCTGVWQVEVYLDTEGAAKVPVPKYFWKALYAAGSKKGIAVVGLNNPYEAEPALCGPLPTPAWLKFLDTTDPAAGQMYACSLDQLATAVQEFPLAELGLDLSGGLLD